MSVSDLKCQGNLEGDKATKMGVFWRREFRKDSWNLVTQGEKGKASEAGRKAQVNLYPYFLQTAPP